MTIMKTNIYAVYDDKVEAFLQPFFLSTHGAAIRGIMECLDDPQHNFHKHAADFTLFHIGTFDESTGQIKSEEVIHNLGNLQDWKKVPEEKTK